MPVALFELGAGDCVVVTPVAAGVAAVAVGSAANLVDVALGGVVVTRRPDVPNVLRSA